MVDKPTQKNEEGQEIQQETPTSEVQPQGTQPTPAPSQTQLSDDQVASLKDSITKDV